MEVPEDLQCLFTARLENQDGTYRIEIPENEVTVGAIEAGGVYRVAMLPQATSAPFTPDAEPAAEHDRRATAPPVGEGEVRDVTIEDIGDQGDGIARVGPGYVVIVPGTDLNETVTVEMTEVRENMAFAEVVGPNTAADRAAEEHGPEPTDGNDDDEDGGIFSKF